MERRTFIKAGGLAAGAMAVPSILHAQNAGQKIKMGFIGVGNRGTQVLHLFMKPGILFRNLDHDLQNFFPIQFFQICFGPRLPFLPTISHDLF